jgi:hypothetical protein
MRFVTVKPAPDRKVRDNQTGEPLPEKGKSVPLTAFWQRRIESGDVLLVDTRDTAKKTKE